MNVASVLAGLGIGGLAVALAAKDTIANFFGSIMIFVDRPFSIGDWVKIEDVEGKVEEVGFRSTRIRTLADSVVTVPNARCMEAKIDNFGVRRYRRLQATLSLTYDTSFERLQAFVEGVRAIVAANDKTEKDKAEVHFAAFGASSLDVTLHCYLEAKTWTEELRGRHDLFLEILRLADALGVRFAFPTRTVHVETLATATQLTTGARAESEKLAEIVRSFGPDGWRRAPESHHGVSSESTPEPRQALRLLGGRFLFGSRSRPRGARSGRSTLRFRAWLGSLAVAGSSAPPRACVGPPPARAGLP